MDIERPRWRQRSYVELIHVGVGVEHTRQPAERLIGRRYDLDLCALLLDCRNLILGIEEYGLPGQGLPKEIVDGEQVLSLVLILFGYRRRSR